MPPPSTRRKGRSKEIKDLKARPVPTVQALKHACCTPARSGRGMRLARICAPAAGGGAGHKNPASAVSGPYGPMDTCGYMSGYESEGREPLLVGINIIIIISMICAIRCCCYYSASDTEHAPWRCGHHVRAGLDIICARLKLIWHGPRCEGFKVLERIWTIRKFIGRLQESGRKCPACSFAYKPIKVWLNRKYGYQERSDHRQGKLPSV